jgi:sec-independent protein translocase protein TatB
MFDIGWGELLLIGVVALIAIGPKELPSALRTLGQMMGKVRRMASEFQNQFQEAMREAELHELKKEVDEMAAKAADYTHFDPIEDIRKDLEKSAGDLPSLDGPVMSAQTPPPAADPSAAALGETGASSLAEAPPPAAEPAPPPILPAPAVEADAGVGKPDAGKAA